MREIKFRARLTKDDKPWMFYQDTQYLISFLRRCTSYIFFGKDGEDGKHESYLPKPLEDYLDEYTGLLDKSGKEIYEGDILSNDGSAIGYILFYKDGWYLYNGKKGNLEGWGRLLDYVNANFKVIGNVWENPELIK